MQNGPVSQIIPKIGRSCKLYHIFLISLDFVSRIVPMNQAVDLNKMKSLSIWPGGSILPFWRISTARQARQVGRPSPPGRQNWRDAQPKKNRTFPPGMPCFTYQSKTTFLRFTTLRLLLFVDIEFLRFSDACSSQHRGSVDCTAARFCLARSLRVKRY